MLLGSSHKQLHTTLYLTAIMTISGSTIHNKQRRLPISDDRHTLRLSSSYYREEGDCFLKSKLKVVLNSKKILQLKTTTIIK
jgi:hypothetical protein